MSDQPDKVVRITLDPSGLAVPDQDPIVVRKNSQKLRWTADFEFRITVDGYDDVKHTSGGGAFDAKTGVFDTERQYKYTISANGRDNDPMIDIKPDEPPPPPDSAG